MIKKKKSNQNIKKSLSKYPIEMDQYVKDKELNDDI